MLKLNLHCLCLIIQLICAIVQIPGMMQGHLGSMIAFGIIMCFIGITMFNIYNNDQK